MLRLRLQTLRNQIKALPRLDHQESTHLELARHFAVAAALRYWNALQDTSLLSAPPPPVTGKKAVGRLADLTKWVGDSAAGLLPLDAAYLIGCAYSMVMPANWRSIHGVFYSPPVVVHRLYGMVDDAAMDWRQLTVVDLACGGGMLLIPAAERMIRALEGQSPQQVVEGISQRIRGFDLDPLGVWLAQLHLEVVLLPQTLASGTRLGPIIRTANSLELDPDVTADLVIGNPPYGRMVLSDALRKRFSRSLFGHANLYGLFTDLAIRWTTPGGLIALVTPTSFLAGQYFKSLRSLLLQEAPPVAVDFISDRQGIFEDVLQETALTTYRRGAEVTTIRVQFAQTQLAGDAQVKAECAIELPVDPDAPWLLPRESELAPLVARLTSMPHRLSHLGYGVSTGPLVWNRRADGLRATPEPGAVPLLWAESVVSGKFTFDPQRTKRQPYFAVGPRDAAVVTRQPCVLVQRTTAKEQARRLIAAELPEAFLKVHGEVVIENHLNMVRSVVADPQVQPGTIARLFESDVLDRVLRCMSGSVAVSATELEALPLPTPEIMIALEALLATGATFEQTEALIESAYAAAT
jgi:adenine-specific DNA-methyltransferase